MSLRTPILTSSVGHENSAIRLDDGLRPELQRPPEKTGRPKMRVKNRASTACTWCRRRRVRCEVLSGHTTCTACQHTDLECLFDKVDERKKPISRAYVQHLTETIAILQDTLRKGGIKSPLPNFGGRIQLSPPSTISLESHMNGTNASGIVTPGCELSQHSCKSRHGPDYTMSMTKNHSLLELDEDETLAEETLRLLKLETRIYLLDLYWVFYNSVIPVIHRKAFDEQQRAGRTEFYSEFLHISMMAIGYRYADKSRQDVREIERSNGESILHKTLKRLLDIELETRPTVSLVAALLLLADLEWGAGRGKQAWLYARLAIRTAIDASLHLSDNEYTLPKLHKEIRKRTFSVCIISEIYWAAFLEPSPSSLNFGSNATSVNALSNFCKTPVNCSSKIGIEMQIYGALFELMALANKISETAYNNSGSHLGINSTAFLSLTVLDMELRRWNTNLPERLKWRPENQSKAPLSYFLLHQQYSSLLVRLHQTILDLTNHEKAHSIDLQPSNSHIVAASRRECTLHALYVAKIFHQYKQQYEMKHIFSIGVKHAEVAALALVAALDYDQSAEEREYILHELHFMFAVIVDMACSYRPAKAIIANLNKLLAEVSPGSEYDFYKAHGEVDSGSSCQSSSLEDTGSHDSVMDLDSNSTRGPNSHASRKTDQFRHNISTCNSRGHITPNSDLLSFNCQDHNTSGSTQTVSVKNRDILTDMSEKQDTLRLALMYAPQLRDLAYF